MFHYAVKDVRQVVAGDTLVLELDLGFRTSTQIEATLSNAKTDRFGQKGQQARLFTENFLKGTHAPFTVQVNKDRKDNYEVQLFASDGEDLGDALVEAKLGER